MVRWARGPRSAGSDLRLIPSGSIAQCGIRQRRAEILGLQIRVSFKDLLLRTAGREQPRDHTDRDARVTNAGPAAHDSRIEHYAIDFRHARKYNHASAAVDVTEEMAMALASRLYQDVALEGTATWDPDTWRLRSFRVVRLLDFAAVSPMAAFHELAAAAGDAWDGVDALEFVRSSREGGAGDLH